MRGCNGASVLAIGSMLLLGGASGSCSEEPAAPATPPAAVEAEAPRPEPPAPAPESTIRIEPANPRAGEPVKLIGGPISFSNGCQGIAETAATIEGGAITVTWKPKEVSADAICTMALHDDSVVAEIESLEPGTYTVTFRPSGGTGNFVVEGGTGPTPEQVPGTGEGTEAPTE